MSSLMKGNVWAERCDAKKRNGEPVVTYPVYVEDKHDEIRCHVKVLDATCPWEFRTVQYLSYAGKPLANMQQFDHVFRTIACGTGHFVFDLGFVCNGNYNDSYRWVRSTKGIPSDLEHAKHKFYVFGLPAHPCSLAKQMNYRIEVAQYAKDWVGTPVLLPHWESATSAEGVEGCFLRARQRGLEGVMVKQPYHMYERKRTDGWLKMKPEADADGIITGLQEAVSESGVPLARIGSVQVELEDGSKASPHGIPFALGRDMFWHPEKYIGQWCELSYMERDRQGGYRHPVFRRLRESK